MPVSELDDALERLAEELSGAAVALGVSAGAETSCAFWGALPDGSGPTSSTVMYGASLTKQLIGVLATMAVGEGRLTYDTEIGDHLTGLPGWLGRVRVSHLLHHTACLRSRSRRAPTR